MVEHYNLSLRDTVLQTGEILRGDDTFLDTIVKQKMKECFRLTSTPSASSTIGAVDLRKFRKQDLAIQRRLLEKIFWLGGSRPSFQHIEEIIGTAHHGQTGTEHHLPLGLRVVKSAVALIFFRPWHRENRRGSGSTPELVPITIQGIGSYAFPELGKELCLKKHSQVLQREDKRSLVLDNNKIQWPLTLRSPQPGERFSPQGMEGTKKISRFLADAKISKYERFAYPVLLSGDKIIAVLGLRAASNVAADTQTREWLLVSWLPLPVGKED